MTPTGPTHTWTISPTSRYLRFHLWLYEADAKTLNFCKLFWGLIMMPLALLIRGAIGVGIFIREFGEDYMLRNPKAAASKVKVTRTTPSRAERMVAWVARAVDRVAAGFQRADAFFARHPGIGNTVERVVGGVAFLLLVGLGVGVVWTAVWSASTFTMGLVTGLKYFGISLGCLTLGITAILVIAMGVTALLEHNSWGRRSLVALRSLFTSTGHGFRSGGRFAALGFHSVKYRTCPQVIVK